MFRSIRKHLNPTSLIAMVALFAALGGVSYAAATIDGKDIKNKSVAGKKLKSKTVTGGKVKSDSLTGTQVKESTLGQVPSAAKATSADSATNATNAQNAANAQSAATAQTSTTVAPDGVASAAIQAGAVTASKLAGVVTRTDTVSVPNGTSRLATASCLAGERPLSGGGIWAGVTNGDDVSQLHIVHTYPSGASGWGVRGYNGTGAAIDLTARVVCLTN
jgi:hypothetical protein